MKSLGEKAEYIFYNANSGKITESDDCLQLKKDKINGQSLAIS